MLRRTLAQVIAKSVTEQRSGADIAASRVEMACGAAYYGKLRPDHYRETATLALESLAVIEASLAELVTTLTYYRMLYPAAHDDDLDRPGYCKCGRWAETCPARLAAENGEIEWMDEDGETHDVADAAPEAPPALAEADE